MSIRNYAVFKDGHEEDIFYYKELPNDSVLFSTQSGIYFYNPDPDIPGAHGLTVAQKFYTIRMRIVDQLTLPTLEFVGDPYLRHIMIDRRIERRFTVPNYGSGSVLVHPNASVESIAVAIMHEMGVKLEEEGE